ncbi:hypothetical protein CPB83DRAFT_880324 [Crepidotus variabilis]|uniref:Uncharacterized protein n=1 Tax=Crepidotus variabilis TaxID=179855 RepID=A0A9P6EQS8_9AGAR|nr:hypothetical protein CPB83DRAFT_880324 [Crepidotus variabilis]
MNSEEYDSEIERDLAKNPKRARGHLISNAKGQLVAVFKIGKGVIFNWEATMSGPVPPFSSGRAVLRYKDERQLGAAHSFKGKVGSRLRLNFENGPMVIGTLDKKIDPEKSITGRGNWKRGLTDASDVEIVALLKGGHDWLKTHS